jgi:hypothetical protein
MAEDEIAVKENNGSDDVQSSDCISILSENRSPRILWSYPTINSNVKSQDSDDMHNSKTSAAENYQEESASNGIIEETSHPASSIDTTKQQASSSVSTNKIDGRMFDDVKRPILLLKRVYLKYRTNQVDV